VQSNAWVEMVVGFVESLPTHDIVLTHSDFHPRNIIVRDDKVVAILDWELAGFYPAYWEYVKANYLPNWDDVWVKERVTD
ncbi:UNVERIFIED_CONTAM: phosphotransferase, partial [Bacteroidetes bacterium 56_B9]